MSKIGLPAVGKWTGSFALLTLSFLGMLSIGLYVMPFAIFAIGATARRTRWWPEGPAGGLIGVGILLLWVAFGQRDYAPCPPSPILVRPGDPGRTCGGRDPLPWLAAGLSLVTAGAVVYVAFRRTPLT